jgi:hypothetical protein
MAFAPDDEVVPADAVNISALSSSASIAGAPETFKDRSKRFCFMALSMHSDEAQT